MSAICGLRMASVQFSVFGRSSKFDVTAQTWDLAGLEDVNVIYST